VDFEEGLFICALAGGQQAVVDFYAPPGGLHLGFGASCGGPKVMAVNYAVPLCGVRAQAAGADNKCGRWLAAALLIIFGLAARVLARGPQPLNNVEEEVRAAREQTRVAQEHPNIPYSPPGLKTPPELRFEQNFQHGAQCGPNAVFVTLRGHGKPVTLKEVSQVMATGDRGASMEDIKRALEHFGLLCELRKQVSPSELANLPVPLIVHLAVPGSRRDLGADHFAVIGGYDAKQDVHLGIDTTSLTAAKFYPGSLVRTMSGYVLYVVGQQSPGTGAAGTIIGWIGGTLLVLVVLANLAVPLYVVSRRRRTALTQSGTT
jgi:hypothetical protein